MSPSQSAPNRNAQFLITNEHTVSLSDLVALRVYSDTRPHNWKTADLQKGLIFIYDGMEMVGEGTGFGVPIVKYKDETFFSGFSRLHVCKQPEATVICKEFAMNKVARNRFRNITLENQKARTFLDRSAELTQKHKHWQSLPLKNLRMHLGIKASFVDTPSMGKINVTYTIKKEHVSVKADFKNIKREKLKNIFMLNEQGSRFFRMYTDSDATKSVDEKIGAWNQVKAQWANITDLNGEVGFRLSNVSESILRRGREFLKDCVNWVGLDYEVDPKHAQFEYGIQIIGV
jgi:hypothetical protein